MTAVEAVSKKRLPRQLTRYWRSLVFVHRWLGVVLCALMLLWAASGVVMMYVAFPDLERREALAGLEPVDLSDCCNLSFLQGQDGIGAARIEMRNGAPVLFWTEARGLGAAHNIETGERRRAPSEESAVKSALSFAKQAYGYTGNARIATINEDQWTVYSRFHPHRPLYKVSLNDSADRVLYVSSVSGDVVQDTSGRERFWNWLGSVPHWLYYTGFRKHQGLWYDFIVWSSLIAGVATALGLYLGIAQYKRNKRENASPYRGIMRWHHITGLIFGVLTFTWVVSGLFSMNPWGLMDGGNARAEQSRLAATTFSEADIESLIDLVRRSPQDDLASAALAGFEDTAFGVLTKRDGHVMRFRLDAGIASTPDINEMRRRVEVMRPDSTPQSVTLLDAEDAYYFAHKEQIELPVWRVVLDDNEKTRYYFSAATGGLLRKVDAPAKQYRWFHHGLHRFDFSSVLRLRPVWDVVVLPLMAGVAFLCGIGVWLSVRRIRMDIGKLIAKRRK